MRNEELAKIMKVVEQSLKQHVDSQLERFSTLLSQHMDSTEERLNQLSQTRRAGEPLAEPMIRQDSTGAENSQSWGQRFLREHDLGEVNSILKTLRIEAPRFDEKNVEN